MTAKVHSGIPRQRLANAERSLIRAAMGIVNSDGWSFQNTTCTHGLNVVLFPGSMRRLEAAIARLKQARKEAKPRRRKFT